MREWWFTIGSGVAIGYFIRWAVERIRAECDLLDRRWEEVHAAREAIPPKPGAPFDFDDVSGRIINAYGELEAFDARRHQEAHQAAQARRRFDTQRPRRD